MDDLVSGRKVQFSPQGILETTFGIFGFGHSQFFYYLCQTSCEYYIPSSFDLISSFPAGMELTSSLKKGHFNGLVPESFIPLREQLNIFVNSCAAGDGVSWPVLVRLLYLLSLARKRGFPFGDVPAPARWALPKLFRLLDMPEAGSFLRDAVAARQRMIWARVFVIFLQTRVPGTGFHVDDHHDTCYFQTFCDVAHGDTAKLVTDARHAPDVHHEEIQYLLYGGLESKLDEFFGDEFARLAPRKRSFDRSFVKIGCLVADFVGRGRSSIGHDCMGLVSALLSPSNSAGGGGGFVPESRVVVVQSNERDISTDELNAAPLDDWDNISLPSDQQQGDVDCGGDDRSVFDGAESVAASVESDCATSVFGAGRKRKARGVGKASKKLKTIQEVKNCFSNVN